MPTHLDNEQSLVAAAQAGDSDAFVTLLNQYSRHIYRVGLSITGNHQDAEDVLQESSLKAYRAIAVNAGERVIRFGRSQPEPVIQREPRSTGTR
jgi:Sigma-70 region 2